MTLLNKIHAKVKQKDYLTFDELYGNVLSMILILDIIIIKHIVSRPKKFDFITALELSLLYAESC